MYVRVPQVMAQFVLKIELLSHIMGTTPILEMARAYGLRPRLWLLITINSLLLCLGFKDIPIFHDLPFWELQNVDHPPLPAWDKSN